MVQHSTLALRLPQNAKAIVPDLIAAHLSGNPDEIVRRRRQYRFALIFSQKREEAKRREQERKETQRKSLLHEECERKQARVRENHEAWLDSFEKLPVGKVSMWRCIRLKLEEPSERG